MTENFQQQLVDQPAVTTNKDEKLLKTIKHISIAVIVTSVICFLCGISKSFIDSLYWFLIWLLPFVAGILGLDSKSSMMNGVFIGFAVVGTLLSVADIALECWWLVTELPYKRLIEGYGLATFIIMCACVLTVLLITLTVLGFMRCSARRTRRVVYVQSSTVQPGNLFVPENQQRYMNSKVPAISNSQPIFVEMVPNNGDVVPKDNVAAQSDNVVSTSEDIEVSSSCVTVIKTIAKTSTSQVNEAYEAEESTKNTSAKTNDSSTSTFVSQDIDAIID